MNPHRTQEVYDTLTGDLRFAADELDAELSRPSMRSEVISGTLEMVLKRLASDLSLQYKPRPPYVECPGCSEAGGAARPVYHEAPICGASEPEEPPAEPLPQIAFSTYPGVREQQPYSVSYADLIELQRKTGSLYARAENSGCESYYVEVARWNEKAKRWERYANAKGYDFRFPAAPDASDLKTVRIAARCINLLCDLGELTPLVYRLPDWTGDGRAESTG